MRAVKVYRAYCGMIVETGPTDNLWKWGAPG